MLGGSEILEGEGSFSGNRVKYHSGFNFGESSLDGLSSYDGVARERKGFMQHHRVLRFVSSAVPDDALIPTVVNGFERISGSFRWELNLVSRASEGDLDLEGVLAQPASLEILQGSGSRQSPTAWRPIHGVLSEFAQIIHGKDWIRYRAVLVPTVWTLSLNRDTRIFQKLTVPDIVRQVLSGHGLSGPAVEFNLQGKYAPREYAVQYQEDDLAFISRLLEHEGMSWYHRYDDERSVLVITDHGEGFASVAGDTTIPYRARADADSDSPAPAVDWYQQEVVDAFACHQQLVPKAVAVQDWNYRQPGHDLAAKEVVADHAVTDGTYLFGEHQHDGSEAKRLAQLRAEELRCRRLVFRGGGDQRGFRCGNRFNLESHPRADFCGDYLLVEVRHEISQALERGSGSGGSTHYANEFTALPVTVTYRPELRTARPVVPGVLNARIDAAGSGQYAELDEVGRYHVKLAFDRSKPADGTASQPMRMVQPYGGSDHGVHFPLHKSAEVLLLHVNGDPDRPIIAGSVPNPDVPSVVTGANQTQSVIRTAGHNELRFEDLKGSEQIFMHATKDRVTEVLNDDTETIGQDEKIKIGRNKDESIGLASQEKVGAAKHVAIGAAYQISVGAAMNESVGASKTEEVGKFKYETVGGKRTLDVGEGFTVTIGAEHHESAVKERSITAKAIKLVAEEEIVFQVGEASITMKKNGDIRISGKNLLLNATGKLSGKASGEVALKGSKTAGN